MVSIHSRLKAADKTDSKSNACREVSIHSRLKAAEEYRKIAEDVLRFQYTAA